MSVWTTFWDMHSGGGRKLDHEFICIPAPEAEAIEIFEKLFNRYPFHVTCDCCGPDYVVDQYATWEDVEATIERWHDTDSVLKVTL